MTSILKADDIQDSSCNNIIKEASDVITIGASGDTITIPSGATLSNLGTATGFGKIGQVVSTTKTDTFSTSSLGGNTAIDVTGLSVAITPSATSSKVFCVYYVNGCNSDGGRQPNFGIRLRRDSTDISLADAAGSRGRTTSVMCFNTNDDDNAQTNIAGNFLDSPSSTSALSYKIQLYNISDGSKDMYVNRTYGDADDDNFRPRATSTITVMEVLA